jgi:hypothetical protein
MSWLRKTLLVAPVSLGFMFAGVSKAADTRPANDRDWFRDEEPVRPGDREGARERPTEIRGDQRYAQRGGDEGSNFPGDNLQDWVVANARAAHARAMFHRNEHDLTAAVRDAQFTYEHSKDFKDAQSAETQAYNDYTAARQRALADVVKDPKYIETIRLRDQLGDLIQRRRANKDINHEELLAIASQKLQFASDARAMEMQALDQSQELKDARKKLVDASSRLTAMRQQFDDSVRSNPQILAARKNLEDARVALITAQAYLDGATAAGGLALDYAYYRHRYDFTHTYDVGLEGLRYPWWRY